MSQEDMILSLGIDTSAGEQQVNDFIATSKRKLSDIKAQMAKNTTPTRTTTSGVSSNTSAVLKAISNQTALDKAVNLTMTTQQRASREMSGATDVLKRVTNATASYTQAVQGQGARIRENARVTGRFSQALSAASGEISKQSGALVTLFDKLSERHPN